MIALMISTMVVSYFKPSARSLALYNFVADIVAVGVTISLIFIDCGSSGDLLTPPSCMSSCSCAPSLTPVRTMSTTATAIIIIITIIIIIIITAIMMGWIDNL